MRHEYKFTSKSIFFNRKQPSLAVARSIPRKSGGRRVTTCKKQKTQGLSNTGFYGYKYEGKIVFLTPKRQQFIEYKNDERKILWFSKNGRMREVFLYFVKKVNTKFVNKKKMIANKAIKTKKKIDNKNLEDKDYIWQNCKKK